MIASWENAYVGSPGLIVIDRAAPWRLFKSYGINFVILTCINGEEDPQDFLHFQGPVPSTEIYLKVNNIRSTFNPSISSRCQINFSSVFNLISNIQKLISTITNRSTKNVQHNKASCDYYLWWARNVSSVMSSCGWIRMHLWNELPWLSP